MNYTSALNLAMSKQGIEISIDEIPFNIFMKNTQDILTLCFLELETDKYIIVVETNDIGAEEVRIIPKENIEYISVFYGMEDNNDNDVIDRMII